MKYMKEIMSGIVMIFLIGVLGFICYHDKGNSQQCGSACHPTPMKSFDPTTGHCECMK